MIIYCCRDLIFTTKIRSTAESLGVLAKPAGNADKLTERLAEGVVRAVLVDLEVEHAEELVRVAKASAGVTVIAFGAHVATDVLQAARDAGADEVMPRGAFTASLPGLLQRLGSSG